MSLRTIFIPTCRDLDAAQQLDAALALGRPLGAHIDVTYIKSDPVAEVAQLPPPVLATGSVSGMIEGIERHEREAAKQAETAFDAWCETHGVTHQPTEHRLDSVFASWSVRTGRLETTVMQKGRVSDITIVKHPHADDAAASRCFDTAVFATGRPALVLPKGPLPPRLLGHVMIAWNTSLEATHAVAQSMEILHDADRVSIFTVPGDESEHPDAELAAALRWHGIEAHLVRPPAPVVSVGAALLAAAQTHEATLILMGAYTHSRVREVLLGGVTRYVLRHGTLPIVMAH